MTGSKSMHGNGETWSVDAGLRRTVARHLAAFAVAPLPDDGRKRAAVAMTVIADDAGRGACILTRRAARLNRHAGHWALPGGRVDPGETPEQAALRELREEVGLALPAAAAMGRLDDYAIRAGYVITPVVVWAGRTVDLAPNPDEVASVHRIRLAELFRPGSPEFVAIAESDRPVIRMLIGEDRIHAPTAAVMYQFREVALAGRDTRVAHFEQPLFVW